MSEAKAPSNLETFLGAEALPLDFAVALHDFQYYWTVRKDSTKSVAAITQLEVDGTKFLTDFKDLYATWTSKEPGLAKLKAFNPVMQLAAAGADYEDAKLKSAALDEEFSRRLSNI
jgi:hypothetical protein